MLQAKEQSIVGLTKGIEMLFKQNKVDNIKGSASFVSAMHITVQLNDGGLTKVKQRYTTSCSVRISRIVQEM
jgi:dihydrolipoamide dehydrogenase